MTEDDVEAVGACLLRVLPRGLTDTLDDQDVRHIARTAIAALEARGWRPLRREQAVPDVNEVDHPISTRLVRHIYEARALNSPLAEFLLNPEEYRQLCQEPGVQTRLDRFNSQQMLFMGVPVRVQRDG